jgi:predicted DCC family thiol-disulfide oxidoreductase YuxK
VGTGEGGATAGIAVVIYDGACGLCQGSVGWVSRRARPGAFEFLPCQAAERRARYPAIAEATCLEAIQLVLPNGRVLGGAAALPEILRRLRGWRWVAALFRLPGAGLIAPVVYRWIARNRYRISCAIGAPRG